MRNGAENTVEKYGREISLDTAEKKISGDTFQKYIGQVKQPSDCYSEDHFCGIYKCDINMIHMNVNVI